MPAIISLIFYICLLGLVYYLIVRLFALPAPILLIVQVLFGIIVLYLLYTSFVGGHGGAVPAIR